MTNKYLRGSEWLKWDLHLHSFYTSLRNEYGDHSLDDYLKKIEDEGIQIIGLTNYFNFNEDDWALKEELEKKGITVFLNLELRLTYTNKEDDCCDLHIIFSDEVNKAEIDTFLTKLNCSVDGTQKILSTLSTLEKERAVVEFEKILEVLKDSAMEKVKNSVLIGMLSRGKGNSRSSRMYESLTKEANFIIHSSDKVSNLEEDINFWSGRDDCKPLVCKALFQSSDAHKTDDIGKKYTWVKGIPCFETLRQGVVDFDNRILIQDRNPMDSKSSSPELFIDKIEYELNDEIKTLYFNKDINSVIGKRGAGKSVLLKHIAWSTMAAEAQKIEKLKNFKVYWCDGKDEDKFIEFIPQNYLSNITYEGSEKYDERDQKLRELLFNNNLFKKADAGITETISSIELKIVANIKDIIKLNKQDSDTQLQLKSMGVFEEKEKAIEEKQYEIKKLGKIDITGDDIRLQTEYSGSLEKLKNELELLEQDSKIIDKINSSNQVDLFTIDDEIFAGLSQTTLNLIKSHVKDLSNTNINNFLKQTSVDLKQKISEKSKEAKSFEDLLSPINEKVKQNKTIEEILKEINKLNVEKEEIAKLKKTIEEIKEKIETLINEIIEDYSSFKEKIENIVDSLKDVFKELKFITFDFTVGYNLNIYKKEFFDVFIDGRSGEKLYQFIDEKRDFNKTELKEIITGIVYERIKIKTSGGDEESALTSLLRCRYEIDFTKSVKYKEEDGNLINFENMTGGQKAMAFLDLIFNLTKSKYPIIIDQPENDIDVSGITDGLKKLILGQKEKRQVIVATHSSNLLLLVDTENVIVAKNETNNIIYQNGGIEKKEIQDSIVNILEGGKEALKKRMDKLNINSF